MHCGDIHHGQVRLEMRARFWEGGREQGRDRGKEWREGGQRMKGREGVRQEGGWRVKGV